MNIPKSISVKSALLMSVPTILVSISLGYILGGAEIGKVAGSTKQPRDVDFSPVWIAWHVINDKFVPTPVASSTPLATTTDATNEAKVYGMISGLTNSLQDPYSIYLPPQEQIDFESTMSGSFEGVGMRIEIKDSVLTVVSPLKGTPAERSGIKSGDRILKIDDRDTRNMSTDTAVQYIRGKKGTQVSLLLYRDGWNEPRAIKVTRDTITMPVVETKKRDDGVFVITVYEFTANSANMFRDALRQFLRSGNDMLVLDLRGNPGGYLDAAVEMASWFLPIGALVVSEDYAGHEPNVYHRSYGYDIFNENLKMAILVDKGSASASEILAGALQYWKKGVLVGTNTFGKGSVQELVPITRDTSIKLTVARWLGPDGIHIPVDGIVPDVMATTTEELVKAGKDVQMDVAIKTLKAMH